MSDPPIPPSTPSNPSTRDQSSEISRDRVPDANRDRIHETSRDRMNLIASHIDVPIIPLNPGSPPGTAGLAVHTFDLSAPERLPEDEITIRTIPLDTTSTGSQSKQCWICFGTEEDDSTATWIQPCNCKGTTKWVHQSCLQQWVDEKQKDSRDKKIACPQCRTEYLIYFPQANKLVLVLDKTDALIYKMCPFIAAGILVGSLYWTAVTYGAVTVMQVAGQNDAIHVMERVEPAVLLTALPTIPVGLIVLKMFHWEDSLLLFLRKTSPSIPLFNHFLPAPVRNESGTVTENPVTEGMCCTRVFTGALLLPTIASICGNMFFASIPSGLQRTIVGGIAFIAVKGIIKMYHKQQVYKRLSKRRILDYTEDNIRRANTMHVPPRGNGASQPQPPQVAVVPAGVTTE